MGIPKQTQAPYIHDLVILAKKIGIEIPPAHRHQLEVITNIVKQYIATLEKEQFPVERAYIFGSHAQHRARKDSDIDVAIVSPGWKSTIDMASYLLSKAHDVYSGDLFIEPHGFHPSEFDELNPIVWEIQRTGHRIK